MRWSRVAGIVVAAASGCGFAGAVALNPDAPRWALALAGIAAVLGLAGVVGIALLACLLVDSLRPRAMFRRPNLPTAIATSDAAFAGQVAFRRYPLRFWGGFIFRERLFVGFMRLDAVEHVRLYKEPQPAEVDA